MKRFISVLMVVVMCISFVSLATYAQRDISHEEELAQELKELGLFRGVSETDFALNRAPSRVEALVMLIRVLGKENDVTQGVWRHPFTDVPKWADKYVGYAYSNGLTNGQSLTQFGNSNANAAMYVTFVLRALGYSDKDGEDFVWSDPFTLARETGIIPDGVNLEEFWRADVVLVSHSALGAYINGTQQTLAEKLVSAGVFTKQKFDIVYNASQKGFEKVSHDTGRLLAEEIYEKCSPAVFYIELYDENNKKMGNGSGFFINEFGMAVTNFHVIKDAYFGRIQLSDSEKMYDVIGVYDYSEKEDWAVIAVDIEGNEYLEIADKSSIVGGATVYALGSPLGLQNTISEGLISNISRELDGVNYIQISAPISSGSSGGALLNEKGEAIGITSAGFIYGQNLNLAIPLSYLEGHQSEAAFSLKKITEARIAAQKEAENAESEQGNNEEEEPLATVNPTAFSLLKGFIEKFHHSVDEDFGKEYTIVVYKSEDAARLFSLYYSDELYCITVKVKNVFSDGYSFEYIFSIEPDVGISGIVFNAKQDTHNAGTVLVSEGYSIMLCQKFNKDYDFEFIDYYGMEWEDTEEAVKAMIDEGLNYLNYMFRTYLWDLGEFSVKDLGYLTYESFFEQTTDEEEFKRAFSSISYETAQDSVTLKKGDTVVIDFEYDTYNFPKEFEVKISTEDESVADVWWGEEDDFPWEINIKGLSEGTTNLIISNTYNYDTVEIPITVMPDYAVEYKLSSTDISVGVDKLTVVTVDCISQKKDVDFFIASKNENVAYVDWDYEDHTLPWNIIIKGISKGTTEFVITNNYTDDNITATVTVK